MAGKECDLFIIGAGSGGVRAARLAAQRGARVAVAETGALGGTCVNRGCIPKKLYSYAAHYAEAFEEAHGFGWPVQAPAFDWELLKANRAREIERLNAVYGAVLSTNGVTLLRGHARLVSPHEVEVGGERWHARHILVATGGHPPNTRSAPTRCSTCRASRAAWSSSAPATSPARWRRSFAASARR